MRARGPRLPLRAAAVGAPGIESLGAGLLVLLAWLSSSRARRTPPEFDVFRASGSLGGDLRVRARPLPVAVLLEVCRPRRRSGCPISASRYRRGARCARLPELTWPRDALDIAGPAACGEAVRHEGALQGPTSFAELGMRAGALPALRRRGSPADDGVAPPTDERVVCAICLEDVRRPWKLRCGHAFCRDCVRRWFARSDACPQCRRLVHGACRRSVLRAWRSFEARLEHAAQAVEHLFRRSPAVSLVMALLMTFGGVAVLARGDPGLVTNLAALQCFVHSAALVFHALVICLPHA